MNDIQTLGIPPTQQLQLEKIIKDNHIQYDLWIESAANFNTLRKQLLKRGFKELPLGDKPAIMPTTMNMFAIPKLPNQKTMLRKTKRR